MKLVKYLVAAGIGLAGIGGGIATAGATEPGQLPCVLGLESDGASVVISPGANDCIVRYSTEDAAVNAITAARAEGDFVWYADGIIVNDGQGFVVRASNYGIPEFFLINTDAGA